MNRLLPLIAPIASAMAAFDTWVANGDRHNDGNLLLAEDVARTPTVLRVAYIDYANALSHSWPDQQRADAVSVVRHYPSQVTPDLQVTAEVVARIEALQEDGVRSIVSRVPSDYLPEAKRDIITAALIARKTKLRSALKSAYPNLP